MNIDEHYHKAVCTAVDELLTLLREQDIFHELLDRVVGEHLQAWLESPETHDNVDAAIRQRAALCDEVERRLRFAERITDWHRIEDGTVKPE